MSNDMVKRYKSIKLSGISKEDVKKQIEDLIGEDSYCIDIKSTDGKVDIIISAEAEYEDDVMSIIKPVSKEIKNRLSNKIDKNKDTAINLETEVVKLLEKHELSISTAESCTGGLLAARFINVPGVSEVYKEGFITYTNKSKRKRLDVSKVTLKKKGAVSKQTAKEMATGVAFNTDSDAALAITGIAGPDGGTVDKPVGLVYIAAFLNDTISVKKYNFTGDRAEIREQAVVAALELMKSCILSAYK